MAHQIDLVGQRRCADCRATFEVGWQPPEPDPKSKKCPHERIYAWNGTRWLRTYELRCGNPECPTLTQRWGRDVGRWFSIAVEELPDGEVWMCPDCQQGRAS